MPTAPDITEKIRVKLLHNPTAAGILIAQFLGAEEHTEAWRSLDVSLVCGGVLAALFLLTAGGLPGAGLGTLYGR